MSQQQLVDDPRGWLIFPCAGCTLIATAWTLCQAAPRDMRYFCTFLLAHLEGALLVAIISVLFMRPWSATLLWLLAVAGAATVFALTVVELDQREDTRPDIPAIGVPMAIFVYAFLHTIGYVLTFRQDALPFLVPFLPTWQAPLTPPPVSKEA